MAPNVFGSYLEELEEDNYRLAHSDMHHIITMQLIVLCIIQNEKEEKKKCAIIIIFTFLYTCTTNDN